MMRVFQANANFSNIRSHERTPPNEGNDGTAHTLLNKGNRSLAWIPALFLPAVAICFGRSLPPWEYMWTSAFAIFFGAKWLTW
jgi:hypothetical protein